MATFKDCPLVLPIKEEAVGYCALVSCGSLLKGKRRRWHTDRCRLKYQHSLLDNHYWSYARKAAKKRDKVCVTCGSDIKLEVNHRIPLVGSGYGPSHAHHLENLQVLCHQCHVKVTSAQRRMRKATKLWIAQ